MTPTEPRPRLVELVVADPPEAWATAGFSVRPDETVRLGDPTVRLAGTRDGTRGITGWALSGVVLPHGHLDGLPTRIGGPATSTDRATPSDGLPTALGSTQGPNARQQPATHPNGATGIDHVVVSTPDLERTIEACEAAGLECRRIREAGTSERPLRQAFFRLGPVVLEVVGGPTGSGTTAEEDPCRWFGLAVDVADLDQTAALLGPALGPIKGAVQAGRRIATARHRDLGLSVAVALMDDHGDR